MDRLKLFDQTIAAFVGFQIDFGVIQADHPNTDPTKSVQIASVNTFTRREEGAGFDLVIVDECHNINKKRNKWIETQLEANEARLVGLSVSNTLLAQQDALGGDYEGLVVPGLAGAHLGLLVHQASTALGRDRW